MCLLQLMKLQRFIENYRRDKGEASHSPDQEGVFRTSESIGTLNSRDQFTTDRSFAIKELPIHPHSHKKANTEERELLKELCASERPPLDSRVFQKFPNKPIQEFCCQPKSQYLPQVEAFGTTFSKSNKPQLARPHFSFRPQLEQHNEDLYEEAPSQAYDQKEQNRMAWFLSHDQQEFLSQLQSLMERVEQLQAQNLQLQQRWLQQEQLSLKYQHGCGMLEEQVGTLKERVTTTIQQNIEIENMIKETLLKQEMQKYHCFTKDQSRKLIKRQQLPPRPKTPL